ncbi:beta-L-arabinofuranosidase domain-containing protein [Siphonobacter sp.]|uniref:glycoside hydrolase family 127 protein n=1 Tax=Siphonobacter sp. TaxID=1869184 RepID=UPI003B3BBAF7
MKRFLFTAVILLGNVTLPVFGQSIMPERTNAKIKVQPVVPIRAYGFPLSQVQLLDSPFRQAMQADVAFLKDLEADRLLADFRSHSGLKPKAEKYGGWESSGLAGHTLGHYLSACAMHYASSKDSEYLNRVNYIVDELAECQKARKTGYIGAIPKEDTVFAEVARGDIRSRGFDLNGAWSPWYTVHKVMAGLLDAYLYCDNAKALTINVGMANWVDQTLKNLNDEQIQKMLLCEYGGMNDVLVNTYALTKNKKFLDLSYKFHDRWILDSLAHHKDILPGKHSNTQIPKLIGTVRRYQLTGKKEDLESASFFWNTVVNHHSYATGGNSNYEYLSTPDQLNDKLTENTMETCNTYNMLKLTRHLFALQPSATFMDYYERGLYNHILASQNHTTGMMCYFVPLRMGARKPFSSRYEDFTCCVGSGMENHTKYNESIYFQGNDGSLYVNLFIPSKLNWVEKGLGVTLQTTLPADSTLSLSFTTRKAVSLPVRIRKPHWATEAVVLLNGKPLSQVNEEAGYLVIDRTWKTGDVLELKLPTQLYSVAMPDNPDRKAYFYGPLILAGNLGPKEIDPAQGVPVFVSNDPNPNHWIKATGRPLEFQTTALGKEGTVTLQPFYALQDDHYSVYWDVFNSQTWKQQQKRYEEQRRQARELELRTVDNLRVGEMQPERDHDFSGDKLETGESHTRKFRVANEGGSFQFTMKVAPNAKNTLIATYWGMDNRGRQFDILVDGKKLSSEDLNQYKESRFYDISYALPAEMTTGKTSVVLTFQAKKGNQAGPVYGIRMLKE